MEQFALMLMLAMHPRLQLAASTAPLPESTMSCTTKENGKVDKCTLAAGHTIEEAIQSMMDLEDCEYDRQQNAINELEEQNRNLLDLSEQLLKSNRKLIKMIESRAH